MDWLRVTEKVWTRYLNDPNFEKDKAAFEALPNIILPPKKLPAKRTNTSEEKNHHTSKAGTWTATNLIRKCSASEFKCMGEEDLSSDGHTLSDGTPASDQTTVTATSTPQYIEKVSYTSLSSKNPAERLIWEGHVEGQDQYKCGGYVKSIAAAH